jgi:putative transposase
VVISDTPLRSRGANSTRVEQKILPPRKGVVDLFSRHVVGWSMNAAMTAQLVTDALVMAIWRRGKPDARLHHSDRGSQYTSEQFQRLMADHGVICSMSRSGNVWDNAAMESFFSSLKIERTNTECTERGMTPRPTSSIILSASTIRNAGTRRSDI